MGGSTTDVSVRPARPDDAAAVARVHVASWQERFEDVAYEWSEMPILPLPNP